MKPTDTSHPDYYHRVVDCQWACPAHTDVPEYIRLISQGRFGDAYLLNRESNVFPGVLGRVCDRPCEPACRRGRVEEKPVAICRLKRVAADLKGDLTGRLPTAPAHENGKRIACIGAGPASLTVANDLRPLGYAITIYEALAKSGGLMRSNIPAFRLPGAVLDDHARWRRPLVDAAERLRQQDASATPAGTVAVFSAKGGVGRTAIAHNLAVAMGQTAGSRVALVDGDQVHGDLRLHLEAPESAPSLVHLPTGHVTEADVAPLLWQDATGLDVLLVEKIGKNISGSGMDPNITGRNCRFIEWDMKPFVKKIAVLGLTPGEDSQNRN